MWLSCDFEAVTLFSLKMSTATASGGKTLLVPTPYAVKIALLDAACRSHGVGEAQKLWEDIRTLVVAVSPARRAVVTNLFQKVLRPRRNAIDLVEPDSGFFQKTIGYREYVFWQGMIGLALGWAEPTSRPWLAGLLQQVSYLGKRGGFIQWINSPVHQEDLPAAYVNLSEPTHQFTIGGTLQILDDCSPDLTFEKANIFSDKAIRTGKDRVLRSIVLPYQVKKSSRSFTLYERSDL